MGGEDGGREEGGKEEGGGEERNPDGPAVGDLERERGRLGLCWEEGGTDGEGCYMLAADGRAAAGCSPWRVVAEVDGRWIKKRRVQGDAVKQGQIALRDAYFH